MDRMLGHASGMIGFPLRLLARENYDKVVRLKGENAVALITGEEKIIPANPRYYICTVESMPVDRQVAFLAVDEIQLAADPDRGHVFTDRLLHARGTIETMFLGAETIKPLIRKLVPGADVVQRPRFSKLVYAGAKKLTRLPRRSAVVAFSVSEVYGIAELLRRHRGGAAVVMGALSPRTRNAQVDLYQGGEVDYLVATDAIGMGLNMDVDHVAFASVSKFDGKKPRALTAPEVAQIAGRAGRHMNEGSFGVTAEVPEMDPDIIARVENHEFQNLQFLHWRNTDLRFVRIETLLADLKAPPPSHVLVRPPPAEDQLVLEAMLRDADVRARAVAPDKIRLLWDVAQVPDFRKLKPEQHARLMSQVYQHLTQGPHRHLPEDWVAQQVARIDRTDGDIHTMMDRIAAIRTWTYLAHRPGWTERALEWQERTRQVEDRLSDALHHKLTHQFVDNRTAHLVRKLRGDDVLSAEISDDGSVHMDGHKLGRLEGLRFTAERTGLKIADRAVINAANAALRPVIAARVDAICAAPDEGLALDDQARLVWKAPDGTAPVIALLAAGPERVKPQVQVLSDERLEAPQRLRLEERLKLWLQVHINTVLQPLMAAREADAPGYVRGIVFQLSEGLGSVRRDQVEEQLKALDEDQRKVLARLGIRFGLDQVFLPMLLKAAPIRLRGQLWIAANPEVPPPALPQAGRVSIPLAQDVPGAFYAACGFRPIAGVGYRIDMFERFAAEARKFAREGQKTFPPATLSLLGINAEAAVAVLRALGFGAVIENEALTFSIIPKKGKGNKGRGDKNRGGKGNKPHHRQSQPKREEAPVNADSPFAQLKALMAKPKSETPAPAPLPAISAEPAPAAVVEPTETPLEPAPETAPVE
ncbi:MAG: disulfide oxidoreductase [Rhodospirillaceae bacterium]|nr:disulfide oxidoreductase [Rhodospirillaceae bacterium]